MVNELQLEEIIDRIERAFGEAPPLSAEPLSPEDLSVLERLFSDDAYQSYLQDQHNRQIIRDYLTNAVILGVFEKERLADFFEQLATEEGRGTLSLHMLMTAVEDAASLASGDAAQTLTPLEPAEDSPPFIKLVPSS